MTTEAALLPLSSLISYDDQPIDETERRAVGLPPIKFPLQPDPNTDDGEHPLFHKFCRQFVLDVKKNRYKQGGNGSHALWKAMASYLVIRHLDGTGNGTKIPRNPDFRVGYAILQQWDEKKMKKAKAFLKDKLGLKREKEQVAVLTKGNPCVWWAGRPRVGNKWHYDFMNNILGMHVVPKNPPSSNKNSQAQV